jgi:DNA-directed RNA polymerase specialized sigma24 family protein
MTDEIDPDAAERILDRIADDPNHAEEIAACIRRYTAARGIDVWAVDFEGYSASEWAEITDRDRSTVSRNIRRANKQDAKRRQESQTEG